EIDRKSAKIKRVVAEQARTAAEVAQIYYPNKFKTEFSLVMSEIMGHLNRLQSLEQISSEERGHIVYYRANRSEEHTSELQSRFDLVCRLLLEKKNKTHNS